jgi:small-conductance mechanosensitive channel
MNDNNHSPIERRMSETESTHSAEVQLDHRGLSEVFDFATSQYAHPRTFFKNIITEDFFRLGCVILGLLGCILCVLVLRLTSGYPIVTEAFPRTLSLKQEFFRWLSVLSIGILLHGLFFSIAYFVPIILSRYFIIKKREIPKTLFLSTVFFINIKDELANVLFFLGMYITCHYFFPLPNVLSKQNVSATQLWKAISSQGGNFYGQHPWQFFINTLMLAVTIGMFLFLIERVIIVRLAIHFHRRTLKTEFEDNKRALVVIKGLKRKILGTGAHIKHQDLGLAMFKRICKPGKHALVPQDFLDCGMLQSDVDFLFVKMDANENGDLTQEEFSVGVSHFYSEREHLHQSTFDQNIILTSLDSILRKLVWVGCIVVTVGLLDPDINNLLTTWGTALLSATILFQGTAAIAFQSIVFIVVTHPFDVGDNVIIGEDNLSVKEIGLWACTFTSRDDGRTVYLTNHKMRTMYIANLKRSPPMDEEITNKISPDTPQATIDELEKRLKSYVSERRREFSNTLIKRMKILDKERMEAVIGLSHKSNFQNMELKLKRSRAFMYYLRQTLAEMQIKLSPPLH